MKPFSIFLLTLLLLCSLAGCSQQPGGMQPAEATTEATEPETTIAPEEVRELSKVITEADIPELESYPNLEKLDLSGSACYTAIVVYAQNHPDVDVTFTVELGDVWVDSKATEIVLTGSEGSFALLNRNLVYFPNAVSLELKKTELSLPEVEQLRSAYPELEIRYTVDILGKEFPEDATEVDLSGLTEAQVERTIPALVRLPALEQAELMDSNGSCSLSKQDVRRLVEAAPGVKFHYIFSLFGTTVSTTDETVEFEGLSLDESCETELRDALAIMTEGSSVILDRCGLSSEFLDNIRKDYTNTDLVWRVWFGTGGRYSYRTNAQTIRAVYNVTNDTCGEMKYCRSVKYMDLGHNETLSDFSFVGYMPELEILIASGSMVSDLSGFENCKKLEFLELAYCNRLEELTPLAGCEGLKNLNICYTKVSNLQALDTLPMEQLFCKRTRVGADEQKLFKQIHPDCIATFYGNEAYAGPGWRYTDYGHTFTEIYKKVREVFHLDDVDKLIEAGMK